ncbi:hypothetical protein FA09DRAFT_215116 [Tilletiopsis washingtonensis]|uniref:Uncharacterized protein n=1 Tax=Tilletiopsis washingtonensis TaxID=58919 RepID=A0A316ZD24_9BASI|nr:hypothetical protein FA09DRAFT_215116 [Tilletiopsis washingtonensis]PWN99677.1 hypothetical protein FA09DRAFT_215116 [Tilletiopsis washingtonensis]
MQPQQMQPEHALCSGRQPSLAPERSGCSNLAPTLASCGHDNGISGRLRHPHAALCSCMLHRGSRDAARRSTPQASAMTRALSLSGCAEVSVFGRTPQLRSSTSLGTCPRPASTLGRRLEPFWAVKGAQRG